MNLNLLERNWTLCSRDHTLPVTHPYITPVGIYNCKYLSELTSEISLPTYLYLLLYHSNSGYTNTLQCYVCTYIACLVLFGHARVLCFFLDRLSKNTQKSTFTKIHSVGGEFFPADGRTDKHYETNSRFFTISLKAPKNRATVSNF